MPRLRVRVRVRFFFFFWRSRMRLLLPSCVQLCLASACAFFRLRPHLDFRFFFVFGWQGGI